MNTIEKTLQFETKKNLKVLFQSENIGIQIIGREESTTDFHVRFEYRNPFEKDIKFEDLVTADYDSKKNTLKIQISDLENVQYVNSKLELFVPHVTEINAKSENGNVSIQNLYGVQTVDTENGPIKIEHTDGKFICKSENGSINFLNANGDAEIECENSSIVMKECEGNLRIDGENGPVKLVNCKGSLELNIENGSSQVLGADFVNSNIKIENGGIYYEFNPIKKGKFKFENENGKIHLVIPDGIPYHILAKNERGSFNVGLEGNYDRRKEGNLQILEMVKESGNVEISATNRNGSIRFVKNPSQTFGVGFDLSSITNTLDKVLNKIPEEIDKEEIRKKIEKAKEKIRKIKVNIPDTGAIVQDTMKGVQEEISDIFKDEKKVHPGDNKKYKKAAEKVNKKIQKVMTKIKTAFETHDHSEKHAENVDEASRLKIFQMLQDGKITADEAERLIKAMEKHNG
ncbi:MAG: hypothetical protein KAW92_03640 [Candidatus Cloacimonetes bacterium]|nr:hypothetical protein [Candidatus Cloacimonadota bacterium]